MAETEQSSTQTPTEALPDGPAASADAWKKRRGHIVTLPSGSKVRFQVPNLAVLAQTGDLPNSLLAVAVPGSVKEDDPVDEAEANARIARLADFQKWLISRAVVEPSISEEDVKDLPTEDVDMLVELATRGRDLDAEGHHIGGLEKSADWRRFRGVPDGDEDFLGE